MRRVMRSNVFLALIALASACSSASSPIAPVSSNVPGPAPTAPVLPWPPAFPVLEPGVAPSAGEYAYTDAGWRHSDYTKASRFVFSNDGRFVLRFDDGAGEYRGTFTYSAATGLITFEWEGWSSAGPWGATGSIIDDVLTISYNDIMQYTDFENAKYKRVQ